MFVHLPRNFGQLHVKRPQTSSYLSGPTALRGRSWGNPTRFQGTADATSTGGYYELVRTHTSCSDMRIKEEWQCLSLTLVKGAGHCYAGNRGCWKNKSVKSHQGNDPRGNRFVNSDCFKLLQCWHTRGKAGLIFIALESSINELNINSILHLIPIKRHYFSPLHWWKRIDSFNVKLFIANFKKWMSLNSNPIWCPNMCFSPLSG